MKKLVIACMLILVVTAIGLPQQRQQPPRRPNARPALEDALLGFYVSQFQQQAEVTDEVFVKILPFLRQFVHDRFEISTRKAAALNQLRMMIRRGDPDEDIKRTIRDLDKADADIQANQEKFLANVDPLLNAQQQARVRMLQVVSDLRIRQMLDRIQNPAQR